MSPSAILKVLLRLAPMILTCVYGCGGGGGAGNDAEATPPVTPKPAVDTLLPAAGRLCEGAFSSRKAVPEQLRRGTLAAGSVLAIRKVRKGEWKAAAVRDLSFLEGQSADEVQTLVCIEPSENTVGTYRSTDPAYYIEEPAYRIDWDVRLVRWPNGLVLAATTFQGGNPHDWIKRGENTHGPEPEGLSITTWMTHGLDDKTILFSSNPVESVAFAPDGKTLASGGSDDTVKLWDVATGKEIRALSGHTRTVRSVAFAPDGKTLASGGSDDTVKLWDVARGKEIRALSGHTGTVRSVAFAPDGKTLASGGYDNTVRLWDVATGKEIRTLSGHSDVVLSVAFAPDGNTLASGSLDNTVKLWDVATGKKIRALSGHTWFSSFARSGPSNAWNIVAFAPDGKIWASGTKDSAEVGRMIHTVKLWDVATGKEVRTLSGHNRPVESVAFAPDGKTLASGGSDDTVKLWDVATGKEIRALSGHNRAVNSVAFAPDGKTLASGSDDSFVKLWDLTIRGK